MHSSAVYIVYINITLFFITFSSDNSDPKTCWISSPSHSTRILRLVDHHRILEYATCPAAYCAGTKGNSGVLRDATCNMWHLVIYLDAHSSVDVAHPNKVTLHICELFVFFFFFEIFELWICRWHWQCRTWRPRHSWYDWMTHGFAMFFSK